MAQLRRKKADFDRAGAELICILPMDLVRCRSYQKKSAGPFTTLSDPAGRASAIYGAARQLIVHNEWVNAPSVFVINSKGMITYAHHGNSWGDRPSADAIVAEANKAAGR